MSRDRRSIDAPAAPANGELVGSTPAEQALPKGAQVEVDAIVEAGA